ncbi:pilus assembly protein [Ruania suaedae]|uniref:pilus assembly protein n=1 Tax=Ruania suaedae TaxID=2897774 RepID=UPI001E4010DC|nr:pilus assembly protein [Ruania suaedae]UFU03993.1 pilus assembly protein [Ruania suaedae]
MMAAVRWLRRRWAAVRAGEDRGSAVVEFLGVALILLVPTVYLIVTLSRVQAAAFAADGAARDAGRLIAQAETMADGVPRAQLAVELAFADQGFDVAGEQALQVTCQDDPCLSPGAYIHLQVGTQVDLPLVPPMLAGALATQVDVQGEALVAVDDFRVLP